MSACLVLLGFMCTLLLGGSSTLPAARTWQTASWDAAALHVSFLAVTSHVSVPQELLGMVEQQFGFRSPDTS